MIWYIIKHLINPYLFAMLAKGIENVVQPKEVKDTNNCATLYSILKSSIIDGNPIDNDYISNIIIAIPNAYNGINNGYGVFLILILYLLYFYYSYC